MVNDPYVRLNALEVHWSFFPLLRQSALLLNDIFLKPSASVNCESLQRNGLWKRILELFLLQIKLGTLWPPLQPAVSRPKLIRLASDWLEDNERSKVGGDGLWSLPAIPNNPYSSLQTEISCSLYLEAGWLCWLVADANRRSVVQFQTEWGLETAYHIWP